MTPFLHFLRSRYQRAYQKRTSQIGRVHLRDHKMGVLDTPYVVQDPPIRVLTGPIGGLSEVPWSPYQGYGAPKRAGGRGEMATGAVGPGYLYLTLPGRPTPPCCAGGPSDLSSAALSLLGTFQVPPSLSYGLPPPPAPLGWPWSLRSLSLRSLPGCPCGTSSSRSFGVAVRRCAPTRLSLWDILLPPLWGGRKVLRTPVLALWATSSSPRAVGPCPSLVLRTASSSLPFGVAVAPVWPCGPSSSLAVLRAVWALCAPVLALRATSSSPATLGPSRPWCATSAASQSQASWRVSPPMGGSEVQVEVSGGISTTA